MYSFQTRVRFSEVDSSLHITLPAILTYFQDCSIFHSSSIGMGVAEMMREGHAWILSSWQIIVNRYPELGEELTISTWAYGWRSFFGYRNFTMTDASGNLAAYANTNWIYTDIHTGRPVKIPKEVSDAYSIEAPLDMEVSGRKISIPKNGTSSDRIFAVRRSDIDSNHHVNNERYVLIAQEFLPDAFVPRQMRAEYKSAAKYGDIMYPVITDEGEKITVVLNNEAGSPYAVIEFRESSGDTEKNGDT